MKIMVVAGHPADMFDHCGGTLLHHIRRGDEVTCVSLTQGLRIHDEVISDVFRKHVDEYTEEQVEELLQERQKVKYAEAVEACRMFGIKDVRFLNYDDEILMVNQAMVSKLAALMREVGPNILITHWPRQSGGIANHHAITGQIALLAACAASGVNFKDRHPACRIWQTFYMLCPADTSSFDRLSADNLAHTDYYVDVTDVIDLKVKALNAMKSQKYDYAQHAKVMAEHWYGTFGNRVRVAYAEGFAIHGPDVGEYLPVSEHQKWLATADEKEIFYKYCTLDAMKVDLDE